MPRTLEFIYDVGSPNAYFAHTQMRAIAAATSAEVTYTPCLLGGIFKLTQNQSPITAFAGVKNKLAYEFLEMERFTRRHGVKFSMNAYFPINTLTLMRGAIAADRLGVGEAYVGAAFDAIWRNNENMGDPAVISRVLTAHGLDADAIFALAGDPGVKQALQENTERAVARGAFGAPTFFIGDEMWFGKERLGAVEDRLKSI